ncbi:MAG TPA: hypothetical protein VM492_09355 [Sumerlaeia bacterium]|nr:hypothetical protein [Sumerlaeia bacterium]
MQIEYLKKLGVKPKQLKGLDVDTAKDLIEELKARKGEVEAIKAAKGKGIALSPRLNALIVFLAVITTLALFVVLLGLVRRLIEILISS